MIIRPPAIEPNSQLQYGLCRWAGMASLAREVHLRRYFRLGPKVLSSGGLPFGGRFRFKQATRCGPPPFLRQGKQKAGPTRQEATHQDR